MQKGGHFHSICVDFWLFLQLIERKWKAKGKNPHLIGEIFPVLVSRIGRTVQFCSGWKSEGVNRSIAGGLLSVFISVKGIGSVILCYKVFYLY